VLIFARDVDSIAPETEVTMRLRQARQLIFLENGPNSGRVALVHFIDPEDEGDIQALFRRKPAKKSMLRAAGSAIFVDYDQRIANVCIPTVRHTTDKSRCRSIVKLPDLNKGIRDVSHRSQHDRVKCIPRAHPEFHLPALSPDVDHRSRCRHEVRFADVVAFFLLLHYRANEFHQLFV